MITRACLTRQAIGKHNGKPVCIITLRMLLRCVISGARVTVCPYRRIYRRSLSNIGSFMILKSIWELHVMFKTEVCIIIKNARKMTNRADPEKPLKDDFSVRELPLFTRRSLPLDFSN